MDEQSEAALVEGLSKFTSKPRHYHFLIRKELYDGLLAVGVSLRATNKIVGKITISVPEKAYGGEIYRAVMETAIRVLHDTWKAYCDDMSEEVFLEITDGFVITSPE